MRLEDLIMESAPGKKGRTTQRDALLWLEKCQSENATENDLSLLNQLKIIAKKLGGRTTVIEVLKAM